MADEESSWLFDYVFEVLQSPTWEVPIATFVDEHCLVFDNEEENKLSHMELHQEFKELVERLLNTHLAEIGICEEDFFNVCDQAYKTKEAGSYAIQVIEKIMACGDFLTFKSIMVRRNKQLEFEAITQYLNDQQDGGICINGTKTISGSTEGKSSGHDEGDVEDIADEDHDLMLALKLSKISKTSLTMPEQHRLAELDKEQAEIEAAIALSLAMLDASDDNSNGGADAAESKTNELARNDSSTLASVKGLGGSSGLLPVDREALMRAESKCGEEVGRSNSGRKNLAPLEGGGSRRSSTSSLGSGGKQSVQQQRRMVEEFLLTKGPSNGQLDAGAGGATDYEVDQVEVARRAKHLKAQRELIMQRKRDERETKLREYERSKRMSSGKSKGGDEADNIPEINSRAMDQGQYLTYALARKMKSEMSVDGGTFSAGSGSGGARGVASSRVGVAPSADDTSNADSLNDRMRVVASIRREREDILRNV